jgi:hypothetical protein
MEIGKFQKESKREKMYIIINNASLLALGTSGIIKKITL